MSDNRYAFYELKRRFPSVEVGQAAYDDMVTSSTEGPQDLEGALFLLDQDDLDGLSWVEWTRR